MPGSEYERMDLLQARRMLLRGHVQGLGIRPIIVRLARSLGLNGLVRNTMQGVLIEIEGSEGAIQRFSHSLSKQLLGEAGLRIVSQEGLKPLGRTRFEIGSSDAEGAVSAAVPVDLKLCDDCRAEMLDARDRRHGYDFCGCTRCGPRYSIVESMPYDRLRTAMAKFEMCAHCLAEYRDAGDRRFFAQANCCAMCGPRLWCADPSGQELASGEAAIDAAADCLRRGQVLALKGIGGYQLLCNATDAVAVERLRGRKRRPRKPFAIMVADLPAALQFAMVGRVEERALTSEAGPIVVLQQSTEPRISRSVNSPLNTIGVMLATSPLHALLLDRCDFPLVVTSGNIDGEPLEYEVASSQVNLRYVADVWLHHNRDIRRPIDDSVVRCIADRIVTLRAGRGLAPMICAVDANEALFAVGAEQKASLSLTNSQQTVLGPHIGDLDSLAGRERFSMQADDLLELYGAAPCLVVHDQHPDFFTTQWAAESGLPTLAVQHHHAHIVAGMVEHGWLDQQVLGVAFDGTGFGPDGTIWGGEFMLCSAAGYRRVGHLFPLRLVGGERAVREPWRIAVSLWNIAMDPSLPLARTDQWSEFDLGAVTRLSNHPRFSIATTSVGRLFDGVAALVFGDAHCHYEAELALRLESECDLREPGKYTFSLLGEQQMWRLDWRPMIRELSDDLRSSVSSGRIAMRFHRGLAAGMLQMCAHFPAHRVVLSGGVFQNKILTELVASGLARDGREVGLPGLIPPGDGGLSIGQLAIAANRLQPTPNEFFLEKS